MLWSLLFLLSFSSLYLKVTAFPSFYHKTHELDETLERLSTSCKYDYKLETILEDPKVQIVTITKNTKLNTLLKKQKVFYLFGEHPRELISPETGLNLINTLCGQTSSSDINIDNLLEKNIFQIVLNANPYGRALVEQGESCRRTNENGIDLNRNWDDHWSPNYAYDTNSGSKAFSEPESLKLKDALEKFRPDIFATVHSGALGMYTPYAYIDEEPIYNEHKMLKVLDTLNGKYCGCDVGAAGDKVGYLCPGTCLDYAYDKVKVPYTYAFEIYSNVKPIPAMLMQTHLLQLNPRPKLRKSHQKDHFKSMGSCFLQQAPINIFGGLANEDCFANFNPTDEHTYNIVIDNWTKALLELPAEIAK